MTDFKEVFENPNDTFCSYFVCVHCNQRVERGINNIATHWLDCIERREGLIYANSNFEKSILDSWVIN